MNNDYIKRASCEVSSKYNSLHKKNPIMFQIVSEAKIRKYIKNLKMGCAAGPDGIKAEHNKYAANSKLVLHLSNLLSLCVTFGLVPDSFLAGSLVPILKKPQVDPSVASNYRPIIVSSVLSKLLEMILLDKCGDYEYSKSQFGFIPARGTDMAICLAHDVASYCWSHGSATFICSLDAAGAFDSIPHQFNSNSIQI